MLSEKDHFDFLREELTMVQNKLSAISRQEISGEPIDRPFSPHTNALYTDKTRLSSLLDEDVHVLIAKENPPLREYDDVERLSFWN